MIFDATTIATALCSVLDAESKAKQTGIPHSVVLVRGTEFDVVQTDIARKGGRRVLETINPPQKPKEANNT